MSLPVVGQWLPDGPPTWIDVPVGAFAVGFLASVLAAGPVANSAVGARVGA